MIKFKNLCLPIGIVAAVIAAAFTGEPDLIRLWFAVWSIEHV